MIDQNSHWKKESGRRKQLIILNQLTELGNQKFGELLKNLSESKESKMSEPTLSNHLKILEDDQKLIEKYYDKVKRELCYRIAPDKRMKVMLLLKKEKFKVSLDTIEDLEVLGFLYDFALEYTLAAASLKAEGKPFDVSMLIDTAKTAVLEDYEAHREIREATKEEK